MFYRRKIHTTLKMLVYLNALPIVYRKQVHPSQLWRYSKLNPSDYFGCELSEILNKEIELIKHFADYPRTKKLFCSILKLFVFFKSTLKKCKGFHSALRKQKYFLVELAQRFKDIIPSYKFSRLIGLNESTLHQWMRQVRVRCSDSLINFCRRVHPNQLLIPEINKMKNLLQNEEFKFWPLRSLHLYAMRNKIISMSQSTWYKYAALLNVQRLKAKTVKIKPVGIRASKPNELWHADVTYFFTPNKIKLYIYTVVDNFSRFPLCVMVSERLLGSFRTFTFKEALKKAIELNPSIVNLQLMTDGGSENFNGNVSEFIEETQVRHIKALADGWPSNSMAEAFNYVLKLFYLNRMDIGNLSALNKALAFAVNDYAYKRPHGILKGLTPYEVYTGQKPQDVSFTNQLQSARKVRVMMNQSHPCSGKCNLK